MKNRGLIIGTLVLFAFVVTSATFAFWAASVTGAEDTATGTVTIGAGDTVETTVTVADVGTDGTLVPVGFEDGTTVNNEDKKFTVEWDGTGAEGATGTLEVTVTGLSLGNLTDEEIEGMFTVDVSAEPQITAGTPLDYTVNVEFTSEPSDQDMYDQVANGSLEITLTFTVTAD